MGISIPPFMKPWFSLASFLAFFLTSLVAQNDAPQVIITNVSVDLPSGAVDVTYDLFDTEYDPCEVWFGISLDGGTTFLSQNGTVFGDIGQNIQPGTNRQISWFSQNVPDLYQAVIRVVADDGHPVNIQALVDQVSEQGVYDRLNQIAIKRHHSVAPQGLNQVRDTLLNAFAQYGLQVEQQNTTYQGATYPNVIGRQGGWVHEDTTYIVDAHYDGVTQGPGADDNATGVAATLEIARILSQIPTRKSLRYIGFCFEEQGLVGSNEYVNKGGIKSWEKVRGVLNMEMIGYHSSDINSQTIPPGFDILFPAATAEIESQLNRGNFLIVVGNTASEPLISTYLQAAETYVPQLRTISLAVPGNGQIAPDLRRSDHSRFWDAGYPALMLTDGAETRNKNYHTAKDVVDSLFMPFYAMNVQATLATAITLADPMHAGQAVFDLGDLVSTEDPDHTYSWKATVVSNPVRGQLVLHLDQCEGHQLDVNLINMNGQTLFSQRLQPDQVHEEFTIPINKMGGGTYTVVVRSGSERISRKVVIH